jgi:hypothetical protein
MLNRTLLITALAVTLAPAGGGAQEPQNEYARTAMPAAGQATAPAAIPAPQPPTRQPQQFVNIKLDLTISVTDQRGVPVGAVKTVSLHVVDRDNGRIRMGRIANSAPNPADTFTTSPTPVLNVDATPEILSSGRIRVSINLEYRPATRESEDKEPIHINERLSAVLEDGKPLVVSQTADPASDRHVKVELKASISR